jgi:hypothetical protein
MRVQFSFALLALCLAAGCSTDDGATGENEKKVDNADQSQPSEDASSATRDAAPTKSDAAPTKSDAAVATDDAAVSEPDSGEELDATTLLADATVEDASSEEPDAEPVVKRCGTRGGVTCKRSEFCDFGGDPLCGATDKGGLCTPIPKQTKEYAPVCGCDKHTYDNESVAHAAGVSVLRQGHCTEADCDAVGGELRLSYGAGIPSCDHGQVGWEIGGFIEPAVCCLPKKGTPVDPGICGGFAGFACPKGEFCNYEKGDGCEGIADGAGKCETKPQACTQVYKPVCGCDGHTYPSACDAHGAGISVKSPDACK